MFKDRTFVFWLMAPALVVLLAGPLFLGHVVTRLLIARMRRRPERLPRAPLMRASAAHAITLG